MDHPNLGDPSGLKGAKGETLLELSLRVIFSRIRAKSTQSTINVEPEDRCQILSFVDSQVRIPGRL